jgi:hypothetical protein
MLTETIPEISLNFIEDADLDLLDRADEPKLVNWLKEVSAPTPALVNGREIYLGTGDTVVDVVRKYHKARKQSS